MRATRSRCGSSASTRHAGCEPRVPPPPARSAPPRRPAAASTPAARTRSLAAARTPPLVERRGRATWRVAPAAGERCPRSRTDQLIAAVSRGAARRGGRQSSSLVASAWPILRETAHSSTGSSPSLRCDRRLGATRTAVPAVTVVTSSPRRIVSVPRERGRAPRAPVDVAVPCSKSDVGNGSGHRGLLGTERLRERPELTRDVGAGVGALHLVGRDDREAAPVAPLLTARRRRTSAHAPAPLRPVAEAVEREREQPFLLTGIRRRVASGPGE